MRYHDATRAAGDARLKDFVPRMGRQYESGRNYDLGPDRHRDVSGLSPYLRRRLVLEEDVVAAALAAHGPEQAEKFIQEVVWRGYFKGWLERRPGIWASYRDGVLHDLAALERDRGLRASVTDAEAGTTGLEYFDAWAQELAQTGYLHNHARMWFASIWIFTLGLPWRLGADFFLRHLLDGDPASNTLGWRWVAGLHTRGKAYAAQGWNIAKFTGGRFSPPEGELAASIQGLEATEPDGLPPVTPLRQPLAPDPARPAVLLITEEDCRVEDFDLAAFDICAAATLAASHLRSRVPVADNVVAFETAALQDAARRTGLQAQALRAGAPEDFVHWAAKTGARQIITPYVPQGPLYDWLQQATPALAAAGLQLCEWQRPWDSAIWPHATAGFFKVKKKIPQIIHQRQLL